LPKIRNAENRGLPARWQYIHGAYYYRVPIGLEALWDNKTRYRLGKSLPEAYKAFAERVEASEELPTIGALLDRYLIQVVPLKAPKTRSANRVFIVKLRSVFGHMPLLPFPPKLIYQYVEKRSAKTSARREIEILSHAYTKAVEWGYVDRHPFKGEVRLKGEKPRTRYVEDWEVLECLALPCVRKKGSVLIIQASIRLKLLTGLRRGDLLRIKMSDIREDGIHVTPHKTASTSGKSVIYEWSESLRQAIEIVKSVRPVHISPWLFCNKFGESYLNEETGEAHGWDSMWARFMTRVLSETKITVRFTEHDLRAKVGSDAESLERAKALLTHVDARTTQAIYRRKPERVRPAK